MTSIAFYNSENDLAQASFVYHLAWMYQELNIPVLVIDLDAHAKLSALFLENHELQEIWQDDAKIRTVYQALKPLLGGQKGLSEVQSWQISQNLHLIPGDLEFTTFENRLMQAGENQALSEKHLLPLVSVLKQIIKNTAKKLQAKLILLNLGANPGALSLSAFIAAERVLFPILPEYFNMKAFQIFGDFLSDWQKTRADGFNHKQVLGYVLLPVPYSSRETSILTQSRSERMPELFYKHILKKAQTEIPALIEDPYFIGQIREYSGLAYLATQARKPMFQLSPADGAGGATVEAVNRLFSEYQALAKRINSTLFENAK